MSTPTGKPGQPIDPFAHALQDTYPHRHRHTPANRAPRRGGAAPRTLTRGEPPLGWIRGGEAAARPPPPPKPPPALGRAPADVKGRRHGSEMLDFRAPRSLEPERM